MTGEFERCCRSEKSFSVDVDAEDAAGPVEDERLVPSAALHRPKRNSGRSRSAGAEKLSARDRIVLAHLPLVKAIAVRVHETLPVHVDVDDLTHAGVLGLIDAASRFDPGKQVSFASYAKHRIRGAILDSLRQLDWASRDLRRRHRQLEAVTRDLCRELGRIPTEVETAERLGIELERLRQMTLEMRNVGLISADTRATDHEDLPAPEFAGDEETQPDLICSREQMRDALDRAMTGLPPRYRQVVTFYYRNEMTMKEIGNVLGINESRVSQIHKSALEKMQVALQTAGIHSSAAF
jgi:RNA polymerase sigma factor for flagellar operon FliA